MDRKTFREDLLYLLSQKDKESKQTTQQAILLALLERAKSGDTKAIKLILGISGEDYKPMTEEEQNNYNHDPLKDLGI
jgi:hypothetical protein